ncbi:hypothetical protein LTR84_002526 [Exophiala bonariae]|uniref:Uncharacterized protein n=1 Tax=Exophiala bonariae TaxID=1690606 RepID=A0AAV9N9P8_9EURO|nr:hypothetical protein LTR84_002526 [Exophiala bonariae]
MTSLLEIQIRDLIYEVMVVLQNSHPSDAEVKIGAMITHQLYSKLQEHPAYQNKHLPHLDAAVRRVAEKIAKENEVELTADLVATIDQFLPDDDGTSEVQVIKQMEFPRSQRLTSTKRMMNVTTGNGNVHPITPLPRVPDATFRALGGYRVQKSKAVAVNEFKGRLITASQLRCLWSCFLPRHAINKTRSNKRKGTGGGNESPSRNN